MPKFKIPVTYEMQGMVEVEAPTLEKAVQYANENIDDLPLPDDPSYIEASYEINDDDFELIELLNERG